MPNIFIKKFQDEINKEFYKNYKVNINAIESKLIKKNNSALNNEAFNNIINIGFTLDPGFILQTMLTISSIMATQNKLTKIVFHFGVIGNFHATHMIKMYQLKKKINNLTEFNFYYLNGAMEKMKNFHSKGEACPGKFELPELLPENVERLLLFDAGDVLIFRDLGELYNYDMKDYWALGPIEPWCISAFMKRYNMTKYINIGSILLNVKELKKNHFWDIYTKNRNLTLGGAPDQTLFNICCPDDKKDYFPFRFGGYVILCSDQESDKLQFNEFFGLKNWFNSEDSKNYPENPGSETGLIAQIYNSVFIHQICEKWHDGKGLSIYKILAKYFIKIADIWDELCTKKPGYCQ